MPKIDPLQSSFNAGELSPRLHARVDFTKYAAGLEECQNLIPLPEGGLTRRPATRYVAEIADSSKKERLIEFEATAEDHYILEFGEKLIRFYFHQGQLVVLDTDAVITNGLFTSNINDWDDRSTGGAGNQISHDATNGRLTLETSGTASDDIGWAEQDVTTTKTGQEHVLKFQVIGDPGDKIEFQVGSTSTGSEILSTIERQVGYHCVAFTPSASPFYVQFRNLGSNADKDVQIDDVSLIDNAALEIGSPYVEADLFSIMGPQSNDVRYLFQKGVAPYKLERRGATTWSLVRVAWQDGPYLDTNLTATTLTPAATSGVAVTVTASSIVGINDGRGFLTTDVGRLVRIDNGAAWGWGIIVSRASTTSVNVHVKKAFAATTATIDWRLGAWSDTTGWPKTGSFFEQRLYVASTDDQPQTLWASQTADFENFKPDDDAGVVEEDDALNYTLSADSVNEIHWLSAGEDTIAIGTSGGEWIPTAVGIVITPLDITIRRQTTQGSALIQPLRIDHVVLFVQKAKRKIRELVFSFSFDSYQAPDITRLASHIMSTGIVEMAYQQEPDSLVWVVREDGVLPTMTFRRDEDVVGWARQIIGGTFGTGNSVVDSVASIIGAADAAQVQKSDDRNEVWVIVKRTINGQTKRYVEFVETYYNDLLHDQEDAYYADSLITYDSAAATVITGLSHLEGETVKVWGDGAILPDVVVTNGQITLSTSVKVAQIGLAYRHRLKTLKIEGGNPAGTALGKTKRIYGITFVLLNSHTLRFGPNDDNLLKKDFRLISSPMDAGVPLFSGEQFFEFDGGLDTDTRIIVDSDDPAPFTLLAMSPWVRVHPTR